MAELAYALVLGTKFWGFDSLSGYASQALLAQRQSGILTRCYAEVRVLQGARDAGKPVAPQMDGRKRLAQAQDVASPGTKMGTSVPPHNFTDPSGLTERQPSPKRLIGVRLLAGVRNTTQCPCSLVRSKAPGCQPGERGFESHHGRVVVRSPHEGCASTLRTEQPHTIRRHLIGRMPAFGAGRSGSNPGGGSDLPWCKWKHAWL